MSIFNYKWNCLTFCAVINIREFFSIHECQYSATQMIFVAEILIQKVIAYLQDSVLVFKFIWKEQYIN